MLRTRPLLGQRSQQATAGGGARNLGQAARQGCPAACPSAPARPPESAPATPAAWQAAVGLKAALPEPLLGRSRRPRRAQRSMAAHSCVPGPAGRPTAASGGGGGGGGSDGSGSGGAREAGSAAAVSHTQPASSAAADLAAAASTAAAGSDPAPAEPVVPAGSGLRPSQLRRVEGAPDCGKRALSAQAAAGPLEHPAAFGFRAVVVADCRYGFEHDGGCIRGAHNVPLPSCLGRCVRCGSIRALWGAILCGVGERCTAVDLGLNTRNVPAACFPFPRTRQAADGRRRGLASHRAAQGLHCEFSSRRAPRQLMNLLHLRARGGSGGGIGSGDAGASGSGTAALPRHVYLIQVGACWLGRQGHNCACLVLVPASDASSRTLACAAATATHHPPSPFTLRRAATRPSAPQRRSCASPRAPTAPSATPPSRASAAPRVRRPRRPVRSGGGRCGTRTTRRCRPPSRRRCSAPARAPSARGSLAAAAAAAVAVATPAARQRQRRHWERQQRALGWKRRRQRWRWRRACGWCSARRRPPPAPLPGMTPCALPCLLVSTL